MVRQVAFVRTGPRKAYEALRTWAHWKRQEPWITQNDLAMLTELEELFLELEELRAATGAARELVN